MHRLGMLLFIVLFAHSAFAADARLDKPVTLAVKGEALSDIMPIIEQQTGVRLRVAHDIADQKATIFVDDKPLKEIMAGLQTVFGYTWSYTDFEGKRSYTLSMPGRLRREREDWRRKATDKAWPDFEAEIKRLADIPVKSTEELDKMLKEADPAHASWVDGLAGMYDEERRKRTIARLYRTLSPDQRNALRDGMTICYDLNSPEAAWRIPTEIEREFRDTLTVFYGLAPRPFGGEFVKRKEFDALSVEISLSQSPDKLSVEAYESVGPCTSPMSGLTVEVYEKRLERLAPTKKDAFPRKDDPVLDGKVFYSAKELEEEAALPKPLDTWRQDTYINRSDLLALLHKKVGLQIISDHYSHWYSWSPADQVPIRTILEGLERYPGASREDLNIAKSNQAEIVDYLTETYPSADWGWDGRLLYMRAANPDRMDSREIPNRLLRPWQEASKAGSFGLDGIAEVNTLTKNQLAMLRDNVGRLGIELGQHVYRLLDPTLRLYGLLSPSQRQLVLKGGLSTSGLNAEQRAALLDFAWRAANPKSYQGCRVGVYDPRGRRVDKPDTGAYPESVRVMTGTQKEAYGVGHRVVAMTPEETLNTIKPSERPGLRRHSWTEYEMVLAYPDGTEIKRRFGVMTYTPVQLPATPEKSGGAAEGNKQ